MLRLATSARRMAKTNLLSSRTWPRCHGHSATRGSAIAYMSTSNSSKCFLVDPRHLFGDDAAEWAEKSVTIDLAPELVGKLQKFDMKSIKHHLATGEDPGNSWVFGEDGELFQLDFAGTLPTPSGYVCLLTPQSNEDATQGEITVADWLQMKEGVDASARKASSHPVGGPFRLPGAVSAPTGEPMQVTLSGQILFAGGVDVYKKRSKKHSAATGVILYGSESM